MSLDFFSYEKLKGKTRKELVPIRNLLISELSEWLSNTEYEVFPQKKENLSNGVVFHKSGKRETECEVYVHNGKRHGCTFRICTNKLKPYLHELINDEKRETYHDDWNQKSEFFLTVDEFKIFLNHITGGDSLMTKAHKEWIVPYNPKYYDLAGALRDLKIIDWRLNNTMKSAQVGDLVYIYASKGSIIYKGAILAMNKPYCTIDDSKYSASEGVSTGPIFEIAMFREYSFSNELTYHKLKEAGLTTKLQSPIPISGSLASYLHKYDKKQIALDRLEGTIPDTCLANFPFKIIEDLSVEEEEIQALDESHSEEEIRKHADSLDLDSLKKIAVNQSTEKPKEVTTSVKQIQRNGYIAEYAKRRANGICQLCGSKAPFNRADGEPYLESHHIIWLSEGGADSIDNTVALCPNCHRKMHVVKNPDDIDVLKTKAKKE